MENQVTVRYHRRIKIITGIIAIPIALIVIAIIFVFVSSVFYRSEKIKQGDYTAITQTNNSITENVTPNTNIENLYDTTKQKLIEGLGNQSFGSENPKLTIVEFADFACPYCKASYPGLRELATVYKDKVKVVFRDWPGHTNSLSLALAAHCSGEQGKFWEMHDKLYASQSTSFGADKNDLATLVAELGIYNEQFQSCFDNQKYLFRVQKNIADGQDLGIKGTPTWFFNGNKVEGELSQQDLEKIIKQYVAQ
ncbi:MAG: thioredoxin domain-containing protein [Candidatus Falkowbacteria bacterium]|nr:thioredoxin domain-containing protein [Candidatus Falkowbacteria bacterium]